jgi:hypothetical protein
MQSFAININVFLLYLAFSIRTLNPIRLCTVRASILVVFPLLCIFPSVGYAIEVKSHVDARISVLTIEKKQLQALSDRLRESAVDESEKLNILDVNIPLLITNHLNSLGMTYEELVGFEDKYALEIANWLTFHIDEREEIIKLQSEITKLLDSI